MVKHYRVGVHTLVDLLYSPESVITPYRDRKGYENGSVIHLKLGYASGETFRRNYVTGDYVIEVIGAPDKVDYKEVWRKMNNLPTTKPYPIEFLGHKDIITPEMWIERKREE
jgi:hypothetical protein